MKIIDVSTYIMSLLYLFCFVNTSLAEKDH